MIVCAPLALRGRRVLRRAGVWVWAQPHAHPFGSPGSQEATLLGSEVGPKEMSSCGDREAQGGERGKVAGVAFADRAGRTAHRQERWRELWVVTGSSMDVSSVPSWLCDLKS